MTDTKTCTRCKSAKSLNEFNRFIHAQDGLCPWCKKCTRESQRAYREANRERYRESRRQQYAADPEKKRRQNEEWKASNPERHKYLVRRSWLKQTYGITHEDYDALLAAQNNACALCGRSADEGRLHIDHDHNCCPSKKSCGKCIRGLLCVNCNRLLGWFDARRDVINSYLNKAR